MSIIPTQTASNHLIFDIGGTWIKSATAQWCGEKFHISDVIKSPSPLGAGQTPDRLANALLELIKSHEIDTAIDSVTISTAGVVDYQGTSVSACAKHLTPLQDSAWVRMFQTKHNCPVTLINDADAALVGAAQQGYLNGDKTTAMMVLGTGVGFSISRNGRRWRPGWNYTLLGSLRIEGNELNHLLSASGLAGHSATSDLCEVLTSKNFAIQRQIYFRNLCDAIINATTIYHLDELLLAGGLADAARRVGVSLVDAIESAAGQDQTKLPKITIPTEGNQLQLLGAAAVARGEFYAAQHRFTGKFSSISTEQPHDASLQLEKMSSGELCQTILGAEQAAGEALLSSISSISKTAEMMAEKLKAGGRIIYLGCGSSGRIGALDDVELNCTYGLEKHRSITLISGGVADASIDIEYQCEEDASSVPELLLLNITPNDVVIGISASGSAYYVRSGLACGRALGAYTVLISEQPPEKSSFFDQHIALNSGGEVVCGSTRMKAGTATKKVLNALTTTTMILLGKVKGTKMVNLKSLNAKLIERAKEINQ